MSDATSQKPTVFQQLLSALETVDRPNTVCVGGDLPLVMPGLEVEGLGAKGKGRGAVRLPLGATQARKLIKLCRQAPYGKGVETVVDTAVRRVWELDPEQFILTNSKWDYLLRLILDDVRRSLGVEDHELAPHLYKLLLYEPGSFFLPHRDGEKLDRMVATLVIGLPAVHQGGELIVTHGASRHEVAFTGAASGHEMSYAAFYADCEHEIRPLTSGYRLCLVYNLTLAKSRGKNGIQAPTTEPAVEELSRCFETWLRAGQPRKLAVTLDHQYTQDGLTLDCLKGVDRARADVLFAAAQRSGCVAHLALLTLWESGSAEPTGNAYYHSRYDRYHDDDEEDDSSEVDMGEIYDSSLSLDHFTNPSGDRVSFGTIPLEQNEIVARESFAEWQPDSEDFEGYTGNAGMTLQRWYHRAVIVLWPQAAHMEVLCSAGADAAIEGLQIAMRELRKAAKSKREEKHTACLEFAAAIIRTWKRRNDYWRFNDGDVDNRSAFLALLVELDDPQLVGEFLSTVAPTDGTIKIDPALAAFCKQHGWATFADELAAVFQAGNASTLERNAELLEFLCVQRDKSALRLELCRELAQVALSALETFDAQPPEYSWIRPRFNRGDILARLVKAMGSVDADAPLSGLIDHALAHLEKYDLTDVHLAAVFALEKWLTVKQRGTRPAISHWLTSCRAALEQRTAGPPRKPADFRRPDKLSCKCADCRQLSEFLADPHEKVHRFSVRKERRQHLHQIIDRNQCDLTHVTERRGSPQTLVCTKTTASYERELEIYRRDQQNLARLVEVIQSCGG